jgi:hypothetical protein
MDRTPAPRPPLPLRKWLWKSYIRAALVPLLLIELSFIGLYWGTSRVVYERGADVVTKLATDALTDTALREGNAIGRRLEKIAAGAQIFADETARVLTTPGDTTPDEKARYAMSPDGAFYTTRDNGGSAVFYSGIVPVGEAEQQKVWRSVILDPLMKSISRTDPLIQQIYFNTYDSYNRIYPYFDVVGIYPPKMDIPSYNFYYEADATHNPDRNVVWTDPYVDPAGSGWMVSAIAPSYGPDRLEAVVGIDVTIGTIIAQVLDLDLQGDSYAILVSRDGTGRSRFRPERAVDPQIPGSDPRRHLQTRRIQHLPPRRSVVHRACAAIGPLRQPAHRPWPPDDRGLVHHCRTRLETARPRQRNEHPDRGDLAARTARLCQYAYACRSGAVLSGLLRLSLAPLHRDERARRPPLGRDRA